VYPWNSDMPYIIPLLLYSSCSVSFALLYYHPALQSLCHTAHVAELALPGLVDVASLSGILGIV
jgi:hypothetical protein